MNKFFYFLLSIMVYFLSNSLQGTETSPMQDNSIPANSIVVIETNQGNIEVALKTDIAPKAVENFVKHGLAGYYNGIIFHRVIKGFMIQGGDPTGTGRGGQSIWEKPFEDEVSSHAKFDRPGILAMANSGPRTNGSQFFITTAPATWLNNKHTIFGEVVKGYDVVQKIEGTKTGPGDRPIEEQKIIRIYLKDANK